MSPPELAQTTIAAISEGTPGLSKTSKQTADKPSQPFAQTSALVNARQMSEADNVEENNASADSLLTGDKSVLLAGVASEPASPANRASAQVRKTTSASGKTQGLEVLMQAAGWNAQTLPPAAPLAKGQLKNGAGQVGNGNVRTAETISTESIRSGRNRQAPGKSSSMVKEHAVGSEQVEAKANAGSDVQGMAEPSRNHVSEIRRQARLDLRRAEAANSKRVTRTLRNTGQASREVHGQDRSSRAAFGDSAQARQAVNGTVRSSSGKEQRLSGPADNLMMHSGPVVSETDKSVAALRAVSDPTSLAESAKDAAAKGPAPSIGEQIRDSMHTSLARGERQLVIRLRPPELGSVLVRFQEQNEQIQGVLEVSRSDARHEVEQALPAVLRNLQDLGIQVGKFEVTVADQLENDPGRQQLQQEAWSQQQGYDRYANRAQQSPGSGGSPGGAEPAGSIDPSGSATAAVLVPPGRIDMLA